MTLAAAREFLAAGRPVEALEVIDRLAAAGERGTAVALLRIEALIEVGQFELSRSLTCALLAEHPDDARGSALLARLDRTLAPPPTGSEDPRLRAYRSDVPRPFLQRMQAAMHHQTYRGIQFVKSPLDVLLYQQLIWRVRPRTIVEIGSKAGGSAVYLGDLLTNFGIDGRILSYDVIAPTDVAHPRVAFYRGDGRRLADTIAAEEPGAWPRPLLVIEDADHTEDTTAAVLSFFHPHLRSGDWLIVEDGNLSDLMPDRYPCWTSGPHVALRAFVAAHGDSYRAAAEYMDMYCYNGTTASNGILERRPGAGCWHRA